MNNKVYIRFGDPKRELTAPTTLLNKVYKNVVVKVLSTVIPKANPDFDQILHKVDYWKIEYDKKKNTAWREIGFNKDGVSIVAMPLGNNYGYWTDNQLTLEDYEYFDPIPISSVEFENDWIEFERTRKK